MNEEKYLIYVDRGFIYGVPARDMSKDEANIYGIRRLLDSGLYRYASGQQGEFTKEDAEKVIPHIPRKQKKEGE